MTAPLAAAREEEWATAPESPPRAPFAQRLVTLTQQEHVQLNGMRLIGARDIRGR